MELNDYFWAWISLIMYCKNTMWLIVGLDLEEHEEEQYGSKQCVHCQDVGLYASYWGFSPC